MRTTDRIWWLLGTLAVIALGVGVQTWAAGQWAGNFDSDEAIFALMTRHILSGGPLPIYMYGNSYLGAGESWFAAWLVELFSFVEPSVFGLRVGSIVLFAGFLAMQSWLVNYLWKWQIALVALLFSALPGALVLWWLYRPIGAFGLLFVCGTGALILSLIEIDNRVLNYGRVFAIGVLLGVGFWSHQLIVVYAAVILVLWVLQSPEWRQIHGLLPPFIWPVVTAIVALIGIVAFFTAGCQFSAGYSGVVTVAQLLLLAVAGWGVVGFGWMSERMSLLQWGGISFAVGFLIGDLPQWASFLLGQTAGENALVPSCPTDIPTRINLLVREVVPHVWGASWLVRGSGTAPFYEIFVSVLALTVMVTAVVFFIWYWRYILGAIVTLRPLVKDDVKIVLVGLLFVLPILLALLGGNTLDVLATRYLLITWQASMMIVGWFLVYVVRTTDVQWSGIALAAVLALQILVGYGALADRWEADRFDPDAVAQLEQFMVENSAYGGYADYWDTYTLNFLMHERVILTPLTGLQRYQQYNRVVSNMPTNVYVFPRDFIETDAESIDLLIEELNSGKKLPAGRPYGQVVTSLQDKEVVQREQIASWDVWIVR